MKSSEGGACWRTARAPHVPLSQRLRNFIYIYEGDKTL